MNIKSEADLHKLLLDRLAKDPRVHNAKIIHGTHEYGVDIIFDYDDPFQQTLRCGIQVKINDIDSSKAKEILGQLAVAFGHKYSRRHATHLDIVYVITNGHIVQPADEMIGSANVGFRNVIFIEGDGLELFLGGQSLDFTKET